MILQNLDHWFKQVVAWHTTAGAWPCVNEKREETKDSPLGDCILGELSSLYQASILNPMPPNRATGWGPRLSTWAFGGPSLVISPPQLLCFCLSQPATVALSGCHCWAYRVMLPSLLGTESTWEYTANPPPTFSTPLTSHPHHPPPPTSNPALEALGQPGTDTEIQISSTYPQEDTNLEAYAS